MDFSEFSVSTDELISWINRLSDEKVNRYLSYLSLRTDGDTRSRFLRYIQHRRGLSVLWSSEENQSSPPPQFSETIEVSHESRPLSITSSCVTTTATPTIISCETASSNNLIYRRPTVTAIPMNPEVQYLQVEFPSLTYKRSSYGEESYTNSPFALVSRSQMERNSLDLLPLTVGRWLESLETFKRLDIPQFAREKLVLQKYFSGDKQQTQRGEAAVAATVTTADNLSQKSGNIVAKPNSYAKVTPSSSGTKKSLQEPACTTYLIFTSLEFSSSSTSSTSTPSPGSSPSGSSTSPDSTITPSSITSINSKLVEFLKLNNRARKIKSSAVVTTGPSGTKKFSKKSAATVADTNSPIKVKTTGFLNKSNSTRKSKSHAKVSANSSSTEKFSKKRARAATKQRPEITPLSSTTIDVELARSPNLSYSIRRPKSYAEVTSRSSGTKKFSEKSAPAASNTNFPPISSKSVSYTASTPIPAPGTSSSHSLATGSSSNSPMKVKPTGFLNMNNSTRKPKSHAEVISGTSRTNKFSKAPAPGASRTNSPLTSSRSRSCTTLTAPLVATALSCNPATTSSSSSTSNEELVGCWNYGSNPLNCRKDKGLLSSRTTASYGCFLQCMCPKGFEKHDSE